MRNTLWRKGKHNGYNKHMATKINIRKAYANELEWINTQYDRVEFKHSHLDNDLIAIAEFNGQKAGLGRLQKIDGSIAELGGIYVLESFRGAGIAKNIVGYLVEHAYAYHTLYCLPFSNLQSFYAQFGFSVITDTSGEPKKVIEKHAWCNLTYSDTVLLLSREQCSEKNQYQQALGPVEL